MQFGINYKNNMAYGIIQICAHCSTPCSGKYCPDCKTAKGRRDMDEANRKHFEEQGMASYVCPVCSKLKVEQ